MLICAGLVIACSEVVAMAIGFGAAHFRADRSVRATLLLRGFDFVPDLVVLGAAWHILPEVEPLLIIVDVVQVQALYLFRRLCNGVEQAEYVAADL